MKALIATADKSWRRRYANALLDCSCNVHTTMRGLEGLDLIRKNAYQIVVFDDSLEDLGPLEFSLALRELRANSPVTLVAAPAYAEKFARLGRVASVRFIGTPDELLKTIPEAVSEANHH